MMANNNVFGDPCPDTNKYAEVKYYCQPGEYSLDVSGIYIVEIGELER